MTPSDEIAAVVRAADFELIDPLTGVVAAELGGAIPAGGVFATGHGLILHHNDPAAFDSALVWSDNPGGYEYVALVGPADLAAGALNQPRYHLFESPTNTVAEMFSGKTPANTATATINAQTNTFNGQGQATIAGRHPASGWGATVSATGALASGAATMQAFGTVTSCSVIADAAGSVTVAPDATAGQLLFGATQRAALLPGGPPQFAAIGANVAFSTAVQTFAMPVSFANCQVGDVIVAQAVISVFRQAITVAIDAATALLTCTNAVGIGAGVANYRAGVLNDIATMVVRSHFQVTVAGVVTVNCNYSSTNAINDYAALAAGRTYLTAELLMIR